MARSLISAYKLDTERLNRQAVCMNGPNPREWDVEEHPHHLDSSTNLSSSTSYLYGGNIPISMYYARLYASTRFYLMGAKTDPVRDLPLVLPLFMGLLYSSLGFHVLLYSLWIWNVLTT